MLVSALVTRMSSDEIAALLAVQHAVLPLVTEHSAARPSAGQVLGIADADAGTSVADAVGVTLGVGLLGAACTPAPPLPERALAILCIADLMLLSWEVLMMPSTKPVMPKAAITSTATVSTRQRLRVITTTGGRFMGCEREMSRVNWTRVHACYLKSTRHSTTCLSPCMSAGTLSARVRVTLERTVECTRRCYEHTCRAGARPDLTPEMIGPRVLAVIATASALDESLAPLVQAAALLPDRPRQRVSGDLEAEIHNLCDQVDTNRGRYEWRITQLYGVPVGD